MEQNRIVLIVLNTLEQIYKKEQSFSITDYNSMIVRETDFWKRLEFDQNRMEQNFVFIIID